MAMVQTEGRSLSNFSAMRDKKTAAGGRSRAEEGLGVGEVVPGSLLISRRWEAAAAPGGRQGARAGQGGSGGGP